MNPDSTQVVSYIVSGLTIFAIHQWMKRRYWYGVFVHHFPGVDKYAHWFMAGGMSLVAATGIHWVWKGTVMAGGILTLTIPDIWSILHGLSDWYKVYMIQWGTYAVAKPPAYQPAPAPAQNGAHV